MIAAQSGKARMLFARIVIASTISHSFWLYENKHLILALQQPAA